MILAGEAFGTQAAKGVAAVEVVVVGGQCVAGLVDKDAARLQVVLQQIEHAIIRAAIAVTTQGVRTDDFET